MTPTPRSVSRSTPQLPAQLSARPTRRLALAAGFGTPLALTLAACGFTFTPGSSSGASDASDASGAPGTRLTLAMMQPPRSALNPFTDDAFKLSRWSCGETLVMLDEDGEPQSALATAWEQVSDLTWRFKLREGVRFHDGGTLDAAAVVTMIEAAMAAAPKPRILDGVELTASAVDQLTVEIATARPDPLLPGRLSSPQLSVLSPAAYADRAVDPTGRATGPFVLTALSGTTSATLDRFEDYWGERAAASGIDVAFVPDGTARGAALRTGEAQIVEAIPVSQVALVDAESIHEVPMPRTNTLYVNVTSPVLSDPSLRAAVREAVQRDQIVRTVYEGHADVAEGLLGPAVAWAKTARVPATYREAGRPTGQALTIGTFTDRAELPEVAVALQASLEAAGFTVRQDVREYANIEQDALAGAFDIFILSRATVLDSGDPVAYMVSDFSSTGSFNLSQLKDPLVDTALDAAAAAPMGDARRSAIMEAERVILETDAAIPLLHERVIQGEAAGIAHAERDPRERALVTARTTAV